MGSAVEIPIALVVVAFVIGVGLIVNYNVFDILDAKDLGASGNATRTALEANVWAGFDLTTLIPIVLGASAVIAILIGAFRVMGA